MKDWWDQYWPRIRKTILYDAWARSAKARKWAALHPNQAIAPAVFVGILFLLRSGQDAAAATLVGAWFVLARNIAQSRADFRRRITESYGRAVSQLASDKIEERLGGIYSLESISKESPDDYCTVMETLTAFVRERSRRYEIKQKSNFEQRVSERANTLWKQAGYPDGQAEVHWVEAVRQTEWGTPTADIAAVLTVISRRGAQNQEREATERWLLDLSKAFLKSADLRFIDLRGAKLVGADLTGANLAGANLTGALLQYDDHFSFHAADLTDADLTDAKLEGANLTGANLTGAKLEGADLSRAKLTRARLIGAKLTGATLSGVELREANMTGANMIGAHLRSADLKQAYLRRADLSEAKLWGADLTGAKLEGAKLKGADLGGRRVARTRVAPAKLAGADLTNADLTDAKNLTQTRLDNAYGTNTKLPPGLTIEPWKSEVKDA